MVPQPAMKYLFAIRYTERGYRSLDSLGGSPSRLQNQGFSKDPKCFGVSLTFVYSVNKPPMTGAKAGPIRT